MSTSRGRSWRPEKSRRARDTRRLLKVWISLLLVVLLAVAGWLLFGPRSEVVNVLVSIGEPAPSDDTLVTVPDQVAARAGIPRLRSITQRLYDANHKRIGEPREPLPPATLMRDGLSIAADEAALIYCALELRLVPDEKSASGVSLAVVLTRPGGSGQDVVPFTQLLDSLKSRKSVQTVLLLDILGFHPGLATGSVAGDLESHLRQEVTSADIDGLTVICSMSDGERSWEFRPDGAGPDESPKFRGTTFAEFVAQALENQQAQSAEALFQSLRDNVGSWVRQNLGETQTVWMCGANSSAAQQDLLRALKAVAAEPSAAAPDSSRGSEPSATGDAKGKTAAAPSAEESVAAVKDASSGTPEGPEGLNQKPEVRLAATLQQLSDPEIQATRPLQPAVWLQLQTELQTARMLMESGLDNDFHQLLDSRILSSIRKLKDTSASGNSRSSDPAVQAAVRWLGQHVSDKAAVDAKLVRNTLDDLEQEPGKAPRLPPEFREPGAARDLLATAFVEKLVALSKSIGPAPEAERDRNLTALTNVLRNLPGAGWPADQWTQSLSCAREVLQGTDFSWQAQALPDVARLLELRKRTLTLLSGHDVDGTPLRASLWKPLEPEIQSVLVTLQAAERWLIAGPPAHAMATERLTAAAKALSQVEAQASDSRALVAIEDHQKLELPWLMQYLAMRQESAALPPEELQDVREMADKVLSGELTLEDFPDGQLESIGFDRSHVEAMLALTRRFSERPLNVDDVRHLAVLNGYAEQRLKSPESAVEQRLLQLVALNSAAIPDQIGSTSGSRRTAVAAHQGIWLGFWSARMVHALGRDARPVQELWRDFVAAVQTGDAAGISKARARFAVALRAEWIAAMKDLSAGDATGVFPAAPELTSSLGREVERHFRVSGPEFRESYSSVLRDLTGAADPVPAPPFTAEPDRLSVSRAEDATTRIRTSASRVYVQNSRVKVKNADQQTEQGWTSVPVDQTTGTVDLLLSVSEDVLSAEDVKLVAVGADGVPVATSAVRILPRPETSWDFEVVQIDEAHPAGVPLNLVKAGSTRRLTLLPSTLDPMTGMHAPSSLKVRLRRMSGVSRKFDVQLFRTNPRQAIWKTPVTMELPEGSDVVDLPLSPPATEATAAPPAAAAPFSSDLTTGLVVQITPRDLQQEVPPVELILQPDLAEPDLYLQRPDPKYDPENLRLRIPLVRKSNPQGLLQPATLPVEFVFSDHLSRLIDKGTAAPLPDVSGSEVLQELQLLPAIAQELNSEDLEFGLSVAGIPHVWWWNLSGGVVRPVSSDQTAVRAFLQVPPKPEQLTIISRPEDLLLGKGWPQAELNVSVFLYGADLEQGDWDLQVQFRRQPADSGNSIPLARFEPKGRYKETVTATAAPNGLWLFSTTTTAWLVPGPLTPQQRSMVDGHYQLLASLKRRNAPGEPWMSATLLTLDDKSPLLNEDSISFGRGPHLATAGLSGTVSVTDPDSGIRFLRVGTDPKLLKNLTINPGPEVTKKAFTIPKSEFPPIEQKDTDNTGRIVVVVEAEDFAGNTQQVQVPVTLTLPGKAGPKPPETPGSIEVTFNSKTKYVVVVRGPTPGKESGEGSVVLKNLMPGKYMVEWQTETGLNPGSKTVQVVSGETTTIVGKP